jgi:hypothetical protein
MIHVTLAISEFVALMLGAVLAAAGSVVGWLLLATGAAWLGWRAVRRWRR